MRLASARAMSMKGLSSKVDEWRLETTIEYSQATAGSKGMNFTSRPL